MLVFLARLFSADAQIHEGRRLVLYIHQQMRVMLLLHNIDDLLVGFADA